MIENGLYQLLTQDSGVSALLGESTGVHFSIAPRLYKPPIVVIHRITAVPIVTLDSTADLLPTRFQFDCYASDAINAKALCQAVYDLLKDFSGDLPGSPPDTHVQACVAELAPFDMPYEVGAKDITFRTITDITIWHANL